MRLPFLRYWAPTSARAPQATQRVHSVASCAWPSASFQRARVATLNVVRAVPVAVYVTSGSCPRWPMSWTRFTSCMVIPPFAPRVKKESKHAFRKEPQGKNRGECCKGAAEPQAERVHLDPCGRGGE